MQFRGTRLWAGIASILIVLAGVGIYLAINRQAAPIAESRSGESLLTGTALAEIAESNTDENRPALIEPAEIAGQPNRLIDEKSPYLRQHAYNPVEWYPWGEEAFEAARRENKPIFLSIGYSSCHWCHVMEEESFKDPEIARLINETFIPILVDREERPDIDSLYMNIAVLLNGSGGWPLNVMMTPDQEPFFAATYIPPESRFGLTGMRELIPQVQAAWRGPNADLQDFAERVATALEDWSQTSQRGELALDESLLQAAYQGLSEAYDPVNGGFGAAPKFPAAHKLTFLLRYWDRSGDEAALEMVERSLQAMRRSAVYDQLEFGFHRYATDAAWRAPHFEKMLYDQAMLAMAYTEAYQATGKVEYARSAQEILIYVLRDMTSPEGGFYAAEDADTEQEEGRVYLWTLAQVREALPEADAELAIKAYQLSEAGNTIDPLSGQPAGDNILYLSESIAELAGELDMQEDALSERLESIRKQLLAARLQRAQPHRDEKILTDWNGLMIAAFAKAGQVFDEPAYTQAGMAAADFVLDNLRAGDGRLLHRYWEADADVNAGVDDYAFFTWGLIELYEASFDVRYLESALDLTDELITYHWDESEGGFFQTPHDAEVLLIRQKLFDDNDLPSGNSVAMLNLLRLGRMTANSNYEDKAAGLAKAFATYVGESPSSYSMLMHAVDFVVGPSYEVIIAGDPGSPATQAMLSALRAEFAPNKVVLLRPPGEAAEIVRLAEFTRYNTSIRGRTTAYVCQDYYCELPTTDIQQMLALLEPTPSP